MTKQEFDFSVDILSALIWQYNKADKLTEILRQKQNWYDENQRDFWQNWLRDVFDLRTANSFGLSVWSIILGLPLSIPLPATGNKNKFGFGQYNKNFNNGPFGSLGSGSTGLTVEQSRQLLQLRYAALVTRPTAYEVNLVLQRIFKGQAYVRDSTTMGQMVYVFGFIPSQEFENAVRTFDILPRPATVGIGIAFQHQPVFGFGPYNHNFNRGSFAGGA